MIVEAKSCGADTVKIQLYDPKKVFGDPANIPEKFSQLEWEAIYAARLGRRQVFWIKAECERVGVNFLASVSDLERLQWLDDVGVDRYKIASDDAMNMELCKVIIGKDKPIIVSDGMADKKDWMKKYLKYPANIFWLYCISDYPTILDKIDFHYYGDLNIFTSEEYDGFSDHTIGISAAVVAMSLGARIIEKHFTMDKTLPGPDHVCSADPEELKQLCRMRDDIEKILHK